MEKLNLYLKALIKDYLNLDEDQILTLDFSSYAMLIDDETRITIQIDPNYYGMRSISLIDNGNTIFKSLFDSYDELETQLQYGFKKINKLIAIKSTKLDFIEKMVYEFKKREFSVKVNSRNLVAERPDLIPIFVRTKFDKCTISYRYANLAPSRCLTYGEDDPSEVVERVIEHVKDTMGK